MALTPVNRGAAPNDGTGDTPYDAFGKVNANATYLEGLADAAQADIDAHELATTTVHGIPDTSALATVNAARTLSAAERPSAGLWLPGTSKAQGALPSLHAGGDMDLRARIQLPTAIPATATGVIGKWGAGRRYEMGIGPAGTLYFQSSVAGESVAAVFSTVAIDARTPLWIRAAVDVSADVTFYTSPDGITWTQLGAPVPAPTASIFDASDPLEVGRNTDLLVYRAQLFYGIGGTLAADANFTATPARNGVHPASFEDRAGVPWTISGAGWEYRDDLHRTLVTATEAAAYTRGVAGGLATFDDALQEADKNAPSGVATLDANRKPVQRPESPLYLVPITNERTVSTPHVATEQVGDKVEVFVDLERTAETTNRGVFGKSSGGSVGQIAYALTIATNNLIWYWGDALATPNINRAYAAEVGVAVGGRFRLKCFYHRDTGAGQYLSRVFWSRDFSVPLLDVTDWTQLGADATGASLGAMPDLNAPIVINATRATSGGNGGNHYGFALRINDVPYAELRFSKPGVYPTKFIDGGSRVWTINGPGWEYRDDLGRTILTAVEAAAAEAASTQSFVVPCSDETTDLAAGVAKATFRMPYAFALTAVRASVTNAPTGSAITVDINEGGTSILSTKLTIDATEKTSTTAAVPAVISDASLADDAEITIDIDAVGSTTPGKGLKVTLIGQAA